MGFIDEFIDLMPDVLIAQPGLEDYKGNFLASGEAISIPCYIADSSRLVRDPRNGQQVVSSATAYLGGYNDLDPTNFRFTLPSRYSPNVLRRALTVSKWGDETGMQYETVTFP